jgi:dipeptidyl aminopeptidase/acylaminoacyl peptidase
MLIRPPGLDAGRKYPVIIELNGEPRHQLVRDVWDGPRHAWHQAMAERGYIVLAFDSHGSGGHGHRFEEPIHYRLGAQEMSDLRDAVDWLRRLPYVDPGRLGVWGSTYNGFLALEAIFTDPGQIKAAVADSPILEWRGQSAPFVERYLGLRPLHHEEYDKSSPLEFSARFAGKLLVVTPNGSARVTADLEGLQSRLAKTRGSAQFLQAGTSNEFFEQMTEFFLRNL